MRDRVAVPLYGISVAKNRPRATYKTKLSFLHSAPHLAAALTHKKPDVVVPKVEKGEGEDEGEGGMGEPAFKIPSRNSENHELRRHDDDETQTFGP